MQSFHNQNNAIVYFHYQDEDNQTNKQSFKIFYKLYSSYLDKKFRMNLTTSSPVGRSLREERMYNNKKNNRYLDSKHMRCNFENQKALHCYNCLQVTLPNKCEFLSE